MLLCQRTIFAVSQARRTSSAKQFSGARVPLAVARFHPSHPAGASYLASEVQLVIINGDVIVGDGQTILKRTTVVVRDHLIAQLVEGRPDPSLLSGAHRVIEADQKLVIPGIINAHAHGTTLGPLFPSAAEPLPREQVIENLDEHMLEGTTTLLNVDGFATIEEVEATNSVHPVRIKTATSHTPWNLKAAEAVDGSGLREVHRQTTVEQMLRMGAVAIGEIGAGHTLGGGGQDYLYIPLAVSRETGREISERQARELKRAVLGRYVDPSAYDRAKVGQVLEEIGLADRLTPEGVKDLIEATVLPPVHAALEGLREAGKLAEKFGVPVVVHNSAPSKKVVLEMAAGGLGRNLIAGHCNHTTFDLQEAVSHARELKERGAVIDLSTFGSFRANYPDEIEMQFALLGEGIVDTVSTDYGGGAHDPMLFVLEQAMERELVSLPQAISLVTGNVAQALPLLAPNRGLVAKGKEADLAIVDRERISQVDVVVIGGRVTVERGHTVWRERG